MNIGYVMVTIIHIISECSELAQRENKARYGWVEKVIYCELCWILKFDHANKWYMYNLNEFRPGKREAQTSLGF